MTSSGGKEIYVKLTIIALEAVCQHQHFHDQLAIAIWKLAIPGSLGSVTC